MKGLNKIQGGIAFPAIPFGAIEQFSMPAMVFFKVDERSTLLVSAGDYVLKGQALFEKNNEPLQHASVSGVVSITDNRISIQSDGLDKAIPAKTNESLSAVEIQSLCMNHGLVGLGGAAFPVHRKLHAAKSTENETVEILLINAAECDPAIYCDEALMQERAAEIVKGIELAITACNAKQCVIGIEENKTRAIEQLKRFLPDKIELVMVPAVYPSGAENTLFSLCTGKTTGLKANRSLCLNIATCYSIYRAVRLSEPLISRVVTVVFKNQIRNFELRLGTPISSLASHLNLAADTDITCGGKMMGWPITTNQSIDKRTNSLIFADKQSQQVSACIRCGACAEVCPQSLLPQNLFWHAKPYNRPMLEKLNLENCIECGCCDIVCPSHIPLTSEFINAKSVVLQEDIQHRNALLAKARYQKRLTRLESQTVRERNKLDNKSAQFSDLKNKDQIKKELIAAALKRSKNKSAEASRQKRKP